MLRLARPRRNVFLRLRQSASAGDFCRRACSLFLKQTLIMAVGLLPIALFCAIYTFKIKKNGETLFVCKKKTLYLRVFKRNKINHNKF